MNIDKIGQKAVEAYVQKSPVAGDKSSHISADVGKKSGHDEVSISETARELRDAQLAVLSAPDVRQDRVAAIKKQIQEGTYQVSVETLADKLLSVLWREDS